MHGAAFRFSLEVHNRRMVLSIIQTYVIPIIEYAAIVWRRNTKIQSLALEKSLRFASRCALRAPYSNQDPAYINFNDRLRILEILSMEERFRIACITFVLKCLKGEVHAEIATRIIGLHRIPTRVTRNPNLFNLINLPIGSPLRGILLYANVHRILFRIEDSIMTTKRNLKKQILDSRN